MSYPLCIYYYNRIVFVFHVPLNFFYNKSYFTDKTFKDSKCTDIFNGKIKGHWPLYLFMRSPER